MVALQEVINAPAQFLGKLLELEGYLLAPYEMGSSIYFAQYPYIKLPPRHALKIWNFSPKSSIYRALNTIPYVKSLHPEFKFQDKAKLKGFLVDIASEILFYPIELQLERPFYQAYVSIETKELEEYSSFELPKAAHPYLVDKQEVRANGYLLGNRHLNLFYLCDEAIFSLCQAQKELSITDETLQKLSLGLDAKSFQKALYTAFGYGAVGTEFMWLYRASFVGELQAVEKGNFSAFLGNIKEALIYKSGIIFKLQLE